MQDELQSLTYISRAAGGLSDDDVFAIYKTAMEYNALDGVTGLLTFDGNCFLQIIEGSAIALDAILGRMNRDWRHELLNIVDRRTINVRSFADWSMKLVRIDRAHMTGVESLAEVLGPRVQPEIRALLIEHSERLDKLA